jgi:hypothetical protein
MAGTTGRWILRGRFAVLLAASALGLILPASAAHAAGLDVSVSPKNAKVGQHTCFRFEVTNPNGNPARDASLRFASDEARTDKRGEVRICTRLEWSGRHFATAYKRSARQGETFVRAHGTGVSDEEWHYIELRLTRNVKCTDLWAMGAAGYCEGRTEARDTAPFADVALRNTWRVGPDFTELLFENQDSGGADRIAGVTDRERGRTGQFYVRSGQWSLGQGRTAMNAVSGTDPGKLGQRGGPLWLVVEYVSEPTPESVDSSYHIFIWGYVQYDVS